MSFTFDMSCLFSTVKNTSGKKMKFGFLPPHGKELDTDEEYTIFGNVLEAVNRFERVTDKRNRDGLQRAIDNGDLLIVETPAPVLQDQTTLAVKVIQLDSGSLAAVDPCWEASASV